MLLFTELTTRQDSDADYMDTAHAIGELTFRHAVSTAIDTYASRRAGGMMLANAVSEVKVICN